ncbi:MAG: SDR family NAD(P)-dependent oxidoreductase [Candidatus Freyarchaeota archaeon]
MKIRLKEKIAIVTGAGRGIGKAIALRFAREGAHVVVADLNLEEAKQTAKEIQSLGRRSLAVKVDVTKKSQVEQMVRETVQEFGRIDILMSNAGVSSMEFVLDMPEEKWDLNMDVNLKGMFLCTQAVAKRMIEQGEGGKIICTASMAGKTGAPMYAHYNASKAGVIAYVKSIALELAPYKINVNAICPGLIATSMQERELTWTAELRGDGSTPESILQEYIFFTPLGRIGQPDDVAKVAAFLASEDSDFMTGQAINVTGGIITTC